MQIGQRSGAVRFAGQREPEGLYDPQHEHDACGVGFVVHVKGQKSHAIVESALAVLINLLHRGACGCEPNTGDGAGILTQMPDRFLRRECLRLGIDLPAPTEYGAGLVFLPGLNPNGIPDVSPGLRGTSYPGLTTQDRPTLKGP